MDEALRNRGVPGFPDIPGYAVRERCGTDRIGAWYLATAPDGARVRLRVLGRTTRPRTSRLGIPGAKAPLPLDVLDLGSAGVALAYADPGLVPLADLLAHAGFVTAGQAVALCLGVRDALAGGEAHGQLGLATILLDRDGIVWVGDTGVAPLRGEEADRHTDAAAVARVATLALTGRPPATDPAPEPSDAATDPGAELRRVLATCATGTDTDFTVDTLAEAVRAYADPTPLVVPPELLPAPALDLAARMRALAADPAPPIELAGGRARAFLRGPRPASARQTGRSRRASPPARVAGTSRRVLSRQGGASGPPNGPTGRRAPDRGHGSGRLAHHAGRDGRRVGSRVREGLHSARSAFDQFADERVGGRAGVLLALVAALGCLLTAAVIVLSPGSRSGVDPGTNRAARVVESAGSGPSIGPSGGPGGRASASNGTSTVTATGGAPGSSASPSVPTPSGPAGPGTEVAAAVLDPTSPATRALGLARDLADLRTRAWADLDLRTAALLNAAGSPAAAADAAALRRARATGLRYDGLEFLVRDATATDVTTAAGEEASLVALDVRMDVSAYAIRQADGSLTRRAESADQQVRLILAWSGHRWQITRVEKA